MKGIKKGLAILLVLCTLLSMVAMTGAAAPQDAAAAQSSNDSNDFMRVFHLDCGRKYFTVSEIEGIIDQLSANHYTHLQLAFGNNGFRFLLDNMSITANGKTYSSATVISAIQEGNDSYDSSKSYNVSGAEELTQEDMDAIIEYAKAKGIEIIPLLNVPGHTTALNDAMSTLGVTTVTGDNMNLGDKEMAFTKALVQKYVSYFAKKGSTYFHMGADEYENSGDYSTFVSYINDLATIIKSENMTPMAFNDCIQTGQNIDTSIVISYWTAGTTSAAELAEAGFKIMNTNNAWYYVMGDALYRHWAAGQWGYTDSKAGLQSTLCTQVPGDNAEAVTPIGSTLCMWCDYPGECSYSDVQEKVYDLIATMASSNPTYFVASDSSDPTPDENSVSVTVAIGETSEVYVQDGQKVIVTTGDNTIATAKVENVKQDGGYTSEPVSDITSGSAYYIQVSEGTYLTSTGGTTTDASQAAAWTFTARNNGYRLTIDNSYLRYANGLTTTTNSSRATTFYFNNGTVYRTYSSWSGYSNPIGSAVNITKNEAVDQTNITFTGVAIGTTSYEIGDTTYNITVTKATETKSVAVGKSIELSVTGTPEVRGAEGFADVTIDDGTVTIQGRAAGSFIVEDDKTIYTVKVTKLDLGDVIEIPITIVDYRADGLLFDWTYNPDSGYSDSYRYGLVHGKCTAWGVAIGTGAAATYNTETGLYEVDGAKASNIEQIEGTTIQKTGNTNTSTTFYQAGTDNDWSRAGLVETNLGSNGMPVYTDAAVQYVAGLLNAGYHNAVSGSCNSLIYDTFVATGAPRSISGTSTTQMSAGFAASQTWDNITNAYDLAWYLLNTFYQADTNMTTVTGTDGQEHSVPIYGMTVDAYDTLYLKGSNGVYTFDAANNHVKYDTDNGAIYEDSNVTSAKFYPLEGLGFEQDGLLKNTSAIDSSRNGDFTLRGEAQFLYKAADNLYFTFKGDDDVYMYINGVLALDLGGAHGSNTKTVSINNLDAEKYNLVDGQVATFTFFYMERCSDASTFSIETNMKLAQRNMTVEKKAYINGVEIADGSAVENGTPITYDLTVTNTGNAKITGLAFTDTDNCGTVINSNESYLDNKPVTNGSVTTKAGSYQYYIDNGSKTTCESYSDLVNAIKTVELQPGETLHIVFLQTTLKATESSTELKTLNYTNTMTIKDSSGLSLSDSHSVYTFDFGDTTNSYVVDFGLPVNTNNLFASGVTVTSVSLDKNPVYGTAVLNSDNTTVTYTPNEVLRGIDVLTLKVQYSINGTTFNTQKTINFVPATTVYYEEGFAVRYNASATGGSKGDAPQKTELAGKKTNVYGYDAAYASAVGDSNGTVMKLAAGAGAATFTFTGTGVDIYTRSTAETGSLMIRVVDGNGALVKVLSVNTVMKNGGTDATDDQEVTAYNVPVVSLSGLAHGTYTLQIAAVKSGGAGAKDVYIDGFRVHGTLENQANDVYTADQEDSPVFIELRDEVLTAQNVSTGSSQYANQIAENVISQVYAASNSTTGAVIMSNNAKLSTTDVQDLLDNGPKNEIYLQPNQALTFKVTTNRVVQIGLKALNQATTYTITGKDTNQTLNASTDMFYEVKGKTDDATEQTITITNTGNGILSITELKICDDPNATLGELTAEDLIPALVSLGYEVEPVDAEAALNITVQAGDQTVTTQLTATGTAGESHIFTAAEIKAAAEAVLPDDYTLDGVTFEDVTVVCGEQGETSYTAEAVQNPTPDQPTKVLQKLLAVIKNIFKRLFRWL